MIVQNEQPIVARGSDNERVSLRSKGGNREGMGGYFDKSKIFFSGINSNGSETEAQIKTVVKRAEVGYSDVFLGDENDTQSAAERYYEKWRFLHKIGIPTVGWMRVMDSEHVLMGDMTVDGSEFIDKAVMRKLQKPRDSDMEMTLGYENFLKINPGDIKKEIHRIQKLAWDNGLILPDDDEEFSVLVHPDGSWQVLVIDLSYFKKRGMETQVDFEVIKNKLFRRLDTIRDDLLQLQRDKPRKIEK